MGAKLGLLPNGFQVTLIHETIHGSMGAHRRRQRVQGVGHQENLRPGQDLDQVVRFPHRLGLSYNSSGALFSRC